MVNVYLGFNALMYAVFSAWCALSPETTSRFVGLSAQNPAGHSEYLAIYGGLQAALAVSYGYAAFQPDLKRVALLFSAVLYGGIVLFRSIAVLRLGFSALGNARFVYILEIVLLIIPASMLLWSRSFRTE